MSNTISMAVPSNFYPVNNQWSPAPVFDSPMAQPPAVSSGTPGELLTGVAAANSQNAAALTRMQSDLAMEVTGPPVAHTGGVDWLATTGTVTNGVGDAAGQGARLATASAATRAAAATASTGSAVAPVLSTAGKVAKFAGPVGTVVASGIQVVQTGADIRSIRNDPTLSEAQKEEQTGAAASEGAGSLAGGLGGAAAGAAIGAVGGPPGIIIGAVIGGLGGGKVGEAVGKLIGESPVGKLVGKLFA